MDPFTQRMLEKAEIRSRALGISSAAASKFPLPDGDGSTNVGAVNDICSTTMALASQHMVPSQQLPNHKTASGGENMNKLQVIEKINKETNSTKTPQKVLRQFAAVDKENMDLGIEINILTDKNVEVQVQVEEEDNADKKCTKISNKSSEQLFERPAATIRDTSRNRLQRLGALYSNKDDLSSPIHRTEGQFHAEEIETNFEKQARLPKHRLGKLAALANTINQWEDDTCHRVISTSSVVQPSSEVDLSKRNQVLEDKLNITDFHASKENKVENKSVTNRNEVKHLKWDPNILTSLEAQGFQRRDSSAVEVSYDFTEKSSDVKATASTDKEKIEHDEKHTVGKLNTYKFTSVTSNTPAECNTSQKDKVIPVVKAGLVSGRAAIFESHTQNNKQNQEQKLQKDPTELPLKERMKLFEKNKGDALVPKAAFGMAPPISKILQESNNKKEDKAKGSQINICTANTSTVKTTVENKVRDKVNALVNAASENRIKEDIRKQREEDLQLLTNRYNKQKDFLTQQQQEPILSRKQIPPPPPLPTTSTNTINSLSKRRSPGNIFDDNKRSRKSDQETQQRLYPVLFDFESNESCASNNDNCCTTATVSAIGTDEEIRTTMQPLNPNNHNKYDQGLDDDNDDSYMEPEAEDSSIDMCNGSLGREIMHEVQKNDKPINDRPKEVRYADKHHYFGDDTVDTSINSSNGSMGVDDYLDEALVDNVNDGDDDSTQDEEDNNHLSRDSKGTTASNSFNFRKANEAKFTDYKSSNEEKREFQTNICSLSANKNSMKNLNNFIPPVKSDLSVNKENENTVTLVHTVSFYRKQQSVNSTNSTPVRKVCHEEQAFRPSTDELDAQEISVISQRRTNCEGTDEDTQSDSDADNIDLIEDKIKRLLEEVCKQQQVIAQTSQALNLCAATIEFSGSTESVEGERHLLVATHRRQACLDEIQRLRVEKTLRSIGAPSEKGRLTVKEITIPLRQDYIRKLSLDTISGHHLVCLLKYNEHVLATKTVPTLPGLLAVKFPDVLELNNVYTDFKVTLEIYGMTAQREILPHEVKYHINLNKKSGIKTPKKKGSENRLVMPPVQSPAGPHVVRTPALVQYGFAIFSLREILRTSWTLTQVLGVSPLEGVIHMKVNCELSVSVEYKGFLTMFEEISGFGAWHRRWCHLNGTMLNYWKYPDDEKKKAPMGTIDLYMCSSQRVNIAPRDICARLNTMLLECQRPSRDTDQESLIIVPNGHTTTVRYLLSADTKEEREEWCAYFNKTLSLLRAWEPPQ